jgi:hypothetical protein
MEEQTFSKKNIDNLSNVCYKIVSLLEQNIDGNLMMTQLMFLGEDIKEFVENPIVKNSGVL